MPYVNCPRCGLSVAGASDQPAWDDCPRCLGRDGISIKTFITQHRTSLESPQGTTRAARFDGRAAVAEPATGSRVQVRHRSSSDGDVLSVTGELDLATAAELERRMHDLEHDGFERLALDLRGVTFMDSTGLTVVIAAELRARQHSREMEIVTAPGQVRRLFELVGVDHQIAFASGLADAESGV